MGIKNVIRKSKSKNTLAYLNLIFFNYDFTRGNYSKNKQQQI